MSVKLNAGDPDMQDYFPYPKPRVAIYRHDINQYGINGWVLENRMATIIGETKEIFVERLQVTEIGYWIGDKVEQKKSVITIGFHRSRFVGWCGDQLCLFENQKS